MEGCITVEGRSSYLRIYSHDTTEEYTPACSVLRLRLAGRANSRETCSQRHDGAAQDPSADLTSSRKPAEVRIIL